MFSRHTRVVVVLALFHAVCACAAAAAQEIETHQRQKLVTYKIHLGPRPVTYKEGEAIAQAAMLHRAQFRGKPDCSHFVHEVYAQEGLDYDYAPTNSIFDGIAGFQRVQKPQPGDIIVWRGHTGVVIDPVEHSFYSSVISGFSIHNYTSRYWMARGAHRFYRYKINDVQSARLLGGVGDHAPSPTLTLANPPSVQQILLLTSGDGNRENHAPAIHSSAPAREVRARSDSVLVENKAPDSVPISSDPKPGKEEIGLAVTAFTEANAQEFSQAAALNGPIEIIDSFEVARIETQGNSGSVDVKVKKVAFFADGKMRLAHSIEKIRLGLVRQAKGWAVLDTDTVHRTYVLRPAAVNVIAGRIAMLARDSAGAQQMKPLMQALGMLLATDLS